MNLRLKNTKRWTRWWKERKVDWKTQYLDTWKHPHRFLIASCFATLPWKSVYEIGVGGGANLLHLLKTFGLNHQVGGCDVSPEAIEFCEKNFIGGVFNVSSADDIMASTDATDVVLSDMTLIYLGPRRIHYAIEEMKRIGRNHVILCEFHSERWIRRLWLRLRTGYNSYNYKKLLEAHDLYDIEIIKVPEEFWPGFPQSEFCHIIKARIPRRK